MVAYTGAVDPERMGHSGTSIGMLLIFATNLCVLGLFLYYQL